MSNALQPVELRGKAGYGPAGDVALQGPVVHIVEDDLSLQQALERLFRSAGIATRVYASAQEFFALPWNDGHGCLLIDVKLPGVDGLAFHEQLKANGILLPAIIMTGYGDIPMSVRAMKAGAVDFLPNRSMMRSCFPPFPPRWKMMRQGVKPRCGCMG